MRTHLVSLLGLSLAAALASFAGCGDPVGSEGAREEVASQGSTITSQYPLVYRAHKVLGPCWHPPCGGWSVRELNVDAPPTIVSRLDFARAGLSDALVSQIEHQDRVDLLVRGAVSSLDESRRHRFAVEEAYLGMPGVEPTGDFRYYEIGCSDASCGGLTASLIDRTEVQRIDVIDVRGAAKPFVDHAWLTDRVRSHGAIVVGRIAGYTWIDPENPVRVLEASQIYVRLRDAAGSCVVPPTLCMAPMTPAWTRNAERCLVFDGCLPPSRTCALAPVLAECGEGYTRVAWPIHGPMCEAVACEPSFVSAGVWTPASENPPQFP